MPMSAPRLSPPGVTPMSSDPVTFADEADLMTATIPDPGTEADYWLDNYPILTQSLGAISEEGFDEKEAAELLSLTVMECADDGVHVDDAAALSVYVNNYIATGD